MSVFNDLASRARDAVGAAQNSLERARLERARRVAERRQEAALAMLGRRTRELVLAGDIPSDRLEPDLAAVRAVEMQIEAIQADLDEITTAGPRRPEPAQADAPAEIDAGTADPVADAPSTPAPEPATPDAPDAPAPGSGPS